MWHKNFFYLLAIVCNQMLMAQDSTSVEYTQGLEVGSLAPQFMAVDEKDTSHTLASYLQKGKVVLVFYRGQWCRYCNKHLSDIQDSIDLIKVQGANVIAISPQKPELIDKTISNTNASFTMLYDEGYKISNAYGLLFTPTDKQIRKYNLIGAQLKKAHSDESKQLPVPATYIINENGMIIWRHFDHNYQKRSSIVDIIKHLKDDL